MPLFPRLPSYLSRLFTSRRTKSARSAYDLWAEDYDDQPQNLVLAWDEEIFSMLLGWTDLENRVVVDIGCGTGRHWQKILDKNPSRLAGYDVSAGMLKHLIIKYPQAECRLLSGHQLTELPDASVGCILSTLTMAHFKNVEKVLREWTRVLQPGGSMIITDFHPAALAKGGKRTFRYQKRTIAIRNYLHPIDAIKNLARQLGLQVLRLVEKPIDESAKHFYEAQNAIEVYEIWKGTPVIYGMLLKKAECSSVI